MSSQAGAKVMKPTRRNAPIAWITLYGALTGVMALVPIFPYVGGGGYVPLLVPFAAIAPLLLGTAGGMVAAIIGGFIGMFIAPAGFPLQVVDVLLTAVLPAVAVGVVIHRRYFIWALLLSLLNAAFAILFPFYVPGAAAGFQAPPEPLFSLLSAYYWVPPLIVILTPIGRRWLPRLAQSEDRRQKYLGVSLALLTGLFIWFNPWSRPYWYILKYAPSLGVATLIGYTWWVPTLALVVTIIAVPLLEALSRSGLPKVEEGLW